MFKIALLATALVGLSSAAVEKTLPGPNEAPQSALACRAAPWAARACLPSSLDTDGDGAFSAAELANFASPPGLEADWTASTPEPDAGLDFKSAATEPRTVLLASLDRERPQSLVPALFALGALVILLRRRPS
jgi:hypothetical protein